MLRDLVRITCLLALLIPAGVRAATFNVTKTADTNDGTCDADCSLREAVTAANSVNDADTIEIPEGTYTLNSGSLPLTTNISLSGAGPSLTILDANESSRVLHIYNENIISISNMTITGGRIENHDGGGIIIYEATVNIDNCIITNNSAPNNYAGGIEHASGNLTISNSTLSNNSSASAGGAIFSDGTLTLNRTAIISNTSGLGGGLYPRGSTTIQNSTIAKNNASGDGGGMRSESGAITVNNSTISGNTSAGHGGGFHIVSGTISLRNSIVDKNLAGAAASNCGTSGSGVMISFGNNIFGASSGCITSDSTDLVESAGLGDFTDSGVPGNAHYPLGTNSPAVNAADASSCTTNDQLGRARKGVCDIGAIEAICGDDIVQPALGESCDDGNSVNTDSCPNTCVALGCGDGILQSNEECEDANEISGDGCSSLCLNEGTPSCGDSIIQTGETCDDGNNVDDDACSNACAVNCGNGIINGGEACDDGDSNSDLVADACRLTCVLPSCGDGVVDPGSNELCDDGNVVAGDGCGSTCLPDNLSEEDQEAIIQQTLNEQADCASQLLPSSDISQKSPWLSLLILFLFFFPLGILKFSVYRRGRKRL